MDAESELPDLLFVPESRVSTDVSTKSGNIDRGTSINLISPPAVLHHVEPPNTSSKQRPTNLGDLLCTLNFDVVPDEEPSREVVTHEAVTESSRYASNESEISHTHNSSPGTVTRRAVVTTTDSSHTSPIALNSELPVQVIVSSENSSPALTPVTRKVVTPDRTTSLLGTEAHSPKSDSNALSSPCSVIRDPDDNELETANALLELGNTPKSFDARYDNSELLPVDAAPLEDITRPPQQDTDNQKEDCGESVDVNNNTSDSEKTVDYSANQESDIRDTEELSPRGKISYKHYGIVRQSPSKSKGRTMICLYCEHVFHSKKAINDHHKAEHTSVKCPDCPKIFPTPDALQRH